MRGGFVGGECAAVEGEGDLDFGFVGRAGYRGGSLGGHIVFVFSFWVSCCVWYGFGGWVGLSGVSKIGLIFGRSPLDVRNMVLPARVDIWIVNTDYRVRLDGYSSLL